VRWLFPTWLAEFSRWLAIVLQLQSGYLPHSTLILRPEYLLAAGSDCIRRHGIWLLSSSLLVLNDMVVS
jgi:hypothetical protein